MCDKHPFTEEPCESKGSCTVLKSSGFCEGVTDFNRDDKGNINGVLVICTETTKRVIDERQLRSLRELAAENLGVKTVEQVCQISARTLANNPSDVPFALLYLLDDTCSKARLAGIAGLDALTPASPQEIEIDAEDEICQSWALSTAIATKESQIVEGLQQKFGLLEARPHTAVVVPLIASGQVYVKGFLIAGISPRRPYDENYQGFFDLVAAQIATAISNSLTWETERRIEQVRETARIETAAVETKMQDALSSIRDGFAILNYNWRFTYLNDREVEIIGIRREDLLGENIWDVFPDLVGSEFYNWAQQVMVERTSRQFEYYYPTWSHWFEIRVYPTPEGIAVLTTDIHERKQTIVALAESEARFRQMAETIENVFWLFDLSAQRHLYISPAYETIWGRSRESLYNNFAGWIDTIHPEDRDRIQLAATRCIENAGLNEEYRIVRPDGSIRTIRDRGFVVYDTDGQPSRLAGVAEDITDDKLAAAALRESQEQLQLALKTAKLGSWQLDLKTNYLTASEQYKANFGLSSDTDFTYQLLLERIHPYDRAWVKMAVETAIANRTDYDVEYRNVWDDNSIHWVLNRGQCIYDAAGNPLKMVGMSMDITDRKRATEQLQEKEARLQFMLECSQIGEWDLDLTTEPYTANRSLKHDQIFGYKSLLPEWSYDIFLNHVHPDHRESVDKKFQETLSTYVDWDFECRIIRADGEIAWIWVRSSVYRDSNGDPMRLIGSVTDITQRKQASEQLRESERRLRRLVESNMFGVILGDSFGGLRYANDYLLNMTGYTLAEIESGGVRWDELTPPDFALLDAKAVEELSTKGVCKPYEKEYRHKNGQRIPILVGAALLDEPFNLNQEVIAFVINLTQLKQVTEERDRFFDLSGDILGIANLEGYFTQVNPAWERILGWTATEITTSLYIEFIHPDDIAVTVAEAQKLAQGLNTIGFENRYRCKDGSYRWLAWNVSSFPEQQVLYCVARDITAQKQIELALRESELNFRTLANSMPQIVWTAFPDGFTDYYNQRWFDYTGMTLEQTQGWGWEPVLHPDDVQKCIDAWSESLRTGNKYNIEYRFRRASDGEYRWFLGRAVPLRNENGQIVKWFGSCTDIHDQKTAHEAAEQANRIKDEFLAVLSHELRTPLNPILGWAKILQRGNLNPTKMTIALETIERNAKLQAQLIDDLLDISRIIRGKLRLNEAPVDLVTVTQAALETVRLAAEAKSITIHTKKASSVGIVNGDEGRLQQVVWNILSNAVKFTPEGGHIWITLSQVENHAQIQIKDTGKGIKKEFVPYMFEHFRQEDSATTRKFGGLGLGLAIVRQIVELHGGTVTADSPGEGQGAVFLVKIPSTSVLKNTNMLPQVNESRSNLKGINILVVDDEPDSRDLISFVLEQEGAAVKAVSSASEALENIAKSVPDLLISDIGMPDMDGYELITTIRASEVGKTIPAIALTAYASEADRIQAISAGFQQHISKPINANTVVDIAIELSKKGVGNRE